jgi:hypothetical protein
MQNELFITSPQHNLFVASYEAKAAKPAPAAPVAPIVAAIKNANDLGVSYFASGSNRPADIAGFAASGVNVGVAVPELSRNAIAELVKLAGTGCRVFVDSGAFSEVRFDVKVGGFVDVAPITEEEWAKRLDVYETLAAALGEQCYLVAPDKVGDQEETLRRLRQYSDRMAHLRSLGANLIVAHQNGRFSLSSFHDMAVEALYSDDMIVGIPSKKGATSTDDVRELLARRPSIDRVHFLGLGPSNGRFAELVAAGLEAGAELFCDSVAISAVSGNDRPGGRPLTAALAGRREEMVEAMWAEGVDGLDYTEAISEPSLWLSARGLRVVADDLGLLGKDRKDWMADPDAWLQEGEIYLDPLVDMVLDAMWSKYVARAAGSWRKRSAIEDVFGSIAA